MTRLRKFLIPSVIVLLIFAIAGGILLTTRFGGGRGWFGGMGKHEVQIALLARQAGHFTNLHATSLNLMFDQLNLESGKEGDYRFVLHTYDLKTLQDRHPGRTAYEALLAENGNIAAVLDNTWGSDLQKSLEPIKNLGIPVISLNADRTADFGSSALFLGSQNMVYTKVANFIHQALVPEAFPELDTAPPEALPTITPPPAPPAPLILLLTEKGYGLTPSTGGAPARYRYEEELKRLNLPIDARIAFTEDDFNKDDVQTRVAAELKEALARDESRPVIAVINAHREWGSRLVRALEIVASTQPGRTFRAIGHDSIFDQSIHDKFQPDTDAGGDVEELSNFEMILMKAPNPEYSTQTFRIYRTILESGLADFDTYPKEVASIFIRRCAVATGLLEYCYKNVLRMERRGADKPDPEWEKKSQVEKDRTLLAAAVRSVRALAITHSTVPGPETAARASRGAHLELGPLGLIHFNADGEEDGSHYFELHKPGNKPMAHLKQLNSENKLIPALQIGINQFEIRRVDVERGEFDAEFICSTTINSALKKKVLDEMKAIREEEIQDEPIPEEKSATGDPRGKLVQYPMLSGLLSIPNMRAEGSVAQIGQTDRSVRGTEYRVYKVRGTFAADLNTVRYPFDSHKIGVELQAAVPDHLLTLTSQLVETAAWEENQRGWLVRWIDALVDNRVANGNPLAMSDHRTETRQFKEFAIMVGVDRNILQPILVVMLPLVLLGLAALGIMYLGEKETLGKSPSELAMGVVLAVVAYSISYADVVPRSGGGTHSDLLYLVTTLLCMGNFGAVLVFGEMGNTKTRNDHADRWRLRYAIGASIFYALFLLYWCTGSDIWPV